MSIQRYHFYNIYGTPIPDNKVIDENGDYVLFTAHAAEVERLTAERDAAVRERDEAVEALRKVFDMKMAHANFAPAQYYACVKSIVSAALAKIEGGRG